MIKRAIVWPDTHIGIEESHDVQAVELALWICRDIQPDYIYFLGDLADFYAASSHAKDPGITSLLKDEIYLVVKFLERARHENPGTEIHFICGNHEYRLEKYIASNAPQLFGLIHIEQILMLEENKIHYHAYNPTQLVRVGDSDLFARHKPFSRSTDASARRALCSVINGHDHRIAQSKIVSADGRVFQSISCGWLGNSKHQIYNYVESSHQWQLGFGLVTMLDEGIYFYDQIEIKNGKCVVDGSLYVI